MQHLKVFAEHQHIHDFFMRTGELVNFHHHIQSELLEAYKANVDPYYSYNNSCPACVAEFITKIYRWYKQQSL